MKYIFWSALLFSANCFAFDCNYKEVTAIQAQSGNVLVQVKVKDDTFPWRNLGSHDSKYIKSFQSIAQQALATGQAVMLRFNDGEPCSKTDYGTRPIAFRIVQ